VTVTNSSDRASDVLDGHADLYFELLKEHTAPMGKVLRVVLLIALMGSSLLAQTGVDFTGRWMLDSPSQPDPGIPTALSVRQSLVSTNVRGEPMQPFFKDITIERQFESGTRSETHQIGVVGGTVSGLGPDGKSSGPRGYHAVKWDANALVFESGSYTGATPETGDWTERREVWTLELDGRLHVVITTRSAAGPRTVSLVYRRR